MFTVAWGESQPLMAALAHINFEISKIMYFTALWLIAYVITKYMGKMFLF